MIPYNRPQLWTRFIALSVSFALCFYTVAPIQSGYSASVAIDPNGNEVIQEEIPVSEVVEDDETLNTSTQSAVPAGALSAATAPSNDDDDQSNARPVSLTLNGGDATTADRNINVSVSDIPTNATRAFYAINSTDKEKFVEIEMDLVRAGFSVKLPNYSGENWLNLRFEDGNGKYAGFAYDNIEYNPADANPPATPAKPSVLINEGAAETDDRNVTVRALDIPVEATHAFVAINSTKPEDFTEVSLSELSAGLALQLPNYEGKNWVNILYEANGKYAGFAYSSINYTGGPSGGGNSGSGGNLSNPSNPNAPPSNGPSFRAPFKIHFNPETGVRAYLDFQLVLPTVEGVEGQEGMIEMYVYNLDGNLAGVVEYPLHGDGIYPIHYPVIQEEHIYAAIQFAVTVGQHTAVSEMYPIYNQAGRSSPEFYYEANYLTGKLDGYQASLHDVYVKLTSPSGEVVYYQLPPSADPTLPGSGGGISADGLIAYSHAIPSGWGNLSYDEMIKELIVVWKGDHPGVEIPNKKGLPLTDIVEAIVGTYREPGSGSDPGGGNGPGGGNPGGGNPGGGNPGGGNPGGGGNEPGSGGGTPGGGTTPDDEPNQCPVPISVVCLTGVFETCDPAEAVRVSYECGLEYFEEMKRRTQTL